MVCAPDAWGLRPRGDPPYWSLTQLDDSGSPEAVAILRKAQRWEGLRPFGRRRAVLCREVARKYTDNCPVDSVKAQFEDGRSVGRRAPYCTLSVAL